MSDSTPSTVASTTLDALNPTSQFVTPHHPSRRRRRCRRRTTTIDDLPEPLIIHILSFLYITEAIQTSLISRNFRNLWHSIPSLRFDIYEFYSRSTSPNPRNSNSRQQFADLISKTLVDRSSSLTRLNKFELHFEYTNYHQHKSYVQSWINNVIHDISEIRLNLACVDKLSNYNDDDTIDEDGRSTFHFRLLDLSRSHVELISTIFCNLEFPPATNPIIFPSLKLLELCMITISDASLCDLLARCVNMESLRFKCVKGLEDLKICSTKLKEFSLEGCFDPLWIEICCPSLQKIRISGVYVVQFYSKDIHELEEASLELSNFFQCEDAYSEWNTLLGLFSNVSSPLEWYEALESNDLPSGCKQFAPNLKQLDLRIASYNEDDLNGLAALLKLFPRLEILRLDSSERNNAKLDSHFVGASIVFNMPCLRQVILRKYHGTKAERYCVKLFKKHGVVLEKIKLVHVSSSDKNWKTETVSQKVIS